MKRVSKQKVERLVKKWKKRLLLSGWEVVVVVCPLSEFCRTKGVEAVSEIGVYLPEQRGILRVREDFNDPKVKSIDTLEETVVHELLHCHGPSEGRGYEWCGFTKEQQERLGEMEEDFIDRMARILVAMDKQS